jgi:NhaP-type Na+/H+ or K+/H+ antiporter
VTFAVVGFSIVVQGLTMPILLQRFGFLPTKKGGEPRTGDQGLEPRPEAIAWPGSGH